MSKFPAGSFVILLKSQLQGTKAPEARLSSSPNRGANFLTRLGVRLLLAKSTKPEAAAYIRWALGDVQDAIEDTGGYLLNEAARDRSCVGGKPQPLIFPDTHGNHSALAGAVMVPARPPT